MGGKSAICLSLLEGGLVQWRWGHPITEGPLQAAPAGFYLRQSVVTPAPSLLLGRAELRSQTRGRHAPRETSLVELGSVQNYWLVTPGILRAQPWGVQSEKKKKKQPNKNPQERRNLQILLLRVSFGTGFVQSCWHGVHAGFEQPSSGFPGF